jgi:hypothetical protein
LGTEDISYTITEKAADGLSQSVTAAGMSFKREIDSLSVTRAHAGADDQVAYTNSRTGLLTIKKVVDGSHDPDDTYTFAVFIFYSGTGYVSGTLKTDRGDLKFDQSSGGMPYALVTLKDGESITIQDLPITTPYYGYIIQEAGMSPSASNYTVDFSLDYSGGATLGWAASGNICQATTVNSSNEIVTCKNTVTSDAETEYLNKYKNLTISKAVKDGLGNNYNTDDDFKFTVTLTNGTTPVTGAYTAVLTNADGTTETKTIHFGAKGTSTVNLTNGQTFTIESLPVGVTYDVTEKTYDDYTTTVPTNHTGNLNSDTTVAYVNTHKSASLTLNKTVTADSGVTLPSNATTTDFTFNVTVKSQSGSNYTGTVTVTRGTTSTPETPTNGVLTVESSAANPATLTFNDPVTYTVEEDLTGVNNYALDSSSNTSGSLAYGDEKTAAFTNKYYGTYNGVYVAKVWSGDESDTSKRTSTVVKVQIKKNGEPLKDPFNLVEGTGYTAVGDTTWSNGYSAGNNFSVNTYENGEKVIYTVEETSGPSDYTVSYSDMETVVVNGNRYCKLTVTNTKNFEVPTGINLTWLPFAIVGVLAVIGLGALIFYNEKKKKE